MTLLEAKRMADELLAFYRARADALPIGSERGTFLAAVGDAERLALHANRLLR